MAAGIYLGRPSTREIFLFFIFGGCCGGAGGGSFRTTHTYISVRHLYLSDNCYHRLSIFTALLVDAMLDSMTPMLATH
jgi:hypothetical protein